MADPRVQKLATLLVNYCLEVQSNERVAINGSASCLPLVTEVYRETIRAGGHPLLIWREEIFDEIMMKEANETQLTYLPEHIKPLMEVIECTINIAGANNTRTFTNIEPQRQQKRQASMRQMMETLMQRAARNELRWVTTLYPTNAYAQEADMSLSEYEDFVYSACFADIETPVAEWQKIHDQQQKLVDWLVGKQDVVVKGPNVDLTLSIKERTFINSDGKRNMPSGEIFTGPVEESVNGWVRFTYPAIVRGREVDGIELRFKEGKVVEASAKKNQDFLLTMLDSDPGARYLGEFAIGTNNGIQKFTKSILFDEKIGGTIHMAVGNGYPETGSKNKSIIHWDMICEMRDGGKIWIDDELFYDSGNFLIN